jgi:hypothetical protein
MADGLQISGVNILLEKTTMSEMQGRFGGTIGQTGDAGGYLEWLCLRGNDADGRWVLWLEGDEIDAGRVGSFRWQRVPDRARFDPRCASLPRADDTVHLPLALRLDMSEADAVRVLGQPSAQHGETLLYVYNHDGVDQKKQPFIELNTISLMVRGGKIWAIEVLKASFAD